VPLLFLAGIYCMNKYRETRSEAGYVLYSSLIPEYILLTLSHNEQSHQLVPFYITITYLRHLILYNSISCLPLIVFPLYQLHSV
jgi:hypothetical protein